MTAADVGLCLVCVGLGSTGQVLLRAAAQIATKSPVPGLQAWLTGTSLLAIVTYFAGMALWLLVLSRVPLTQAFAFFGLSFVVVPILANLWLGDPLTPYTWAGALVIISGILLTNWPAARG